MQGELRRAHCLQDEEDQHSCRGDEEERSPADSVAEEAAAYSVNGRPDVQERADEKLLSLVCDCKGAAS